MKKIVFILLLVLPMLTFGNFVPKDSLVSKDNISQAFSYPIEKCQITADYVIIDNNVITKYVIKNYMYDNKTGSLMLLFIENRLFGIKFLPSIGRNQYWAFFDNQLHEIEIDMWADIHL